MQNLNKMSHGFGLIDIFLSEDREVRGSNPTLDKCEFLMEISHQEMTLRGSTRSRCELLP